MTVYVPPINTSGEDVASVLAAVGEQSDKPIVSTFLGSEGVPELLRVTDVQGGAAGRGSVPSYAAPESAVRALARVVNYAEWASRDHGSFQAFEHRTGDARALVRDVLDRGASRRDPVHRAGPRPAGLLRHRPVARGSTCTPARRRSPQARSSAGTSCSRPAASTCGPAPT